jgi:hypothetical protein
MTLKPLAFAALIAIGVVGLAEARSSLLSPPNADRAMSLATQKLALTADQQTRLRPLVERGVALRTQIRNETEAMIQADREELARPDADLAAISAEHQARVDARLGEVRALRDDLLDFYNRELNADQQAKARLVLIKRIDRLDRIRDGLLSLREDAAFGP